MSNMSLTKSIRRSRRKKHVRKVVIGSADRGRLTVTRSLNHIYAQVIDDFNSSTLCSASTLDSEVKKLLSEAKTKVDKSKIVGQVLATRAQSAGIQTVSFDRNGYLYHGRVKALADGAREAGLKF